MPDDQPQHMSRADRAARRREIAEAVQAGMTVPKASVKFGVVQSQVRLSCREHGVPIERGELRWHRGALLAIVAVLQQSDPEIGFAAVGRKLRPHVTRERVRQVYREARRRGIDVGDWGK